MRIDRAAVLELSPASVLALKLIALGWMVQGHADWFLADGAWGVHYGIGRTVFVIFGFLFAWHLARVGDEAVFVRVLGRLAVIGAISTLPYAYLLGSWFPLNILATYALALACWWCWLRGYGLSAALLFLFGGVLVDYGWIGTAGVLLCLWCFRRDRGLLVPLLMFSGLLIAFNGSAWSLLAVPVVLGTAWLVRGPAPRLKWLFYVVYPLHLFILAAVALWV